MASIPRPIQLVSNTELYNRWAKVYDTDGNILQAIDDAEIPSLLRKTFALLGQDQASTTSTLPLVITELGCGTGRNTAKLLSPLLSETPISRINALDLSPGMLDVARKRLAPSVPNSSSSGARPLEIDFYEFDALTPSEYPAVAALAGHSDLVISTLVLEHLPLDIFFSTVRDLLKPPFSSSHRQGASSSFVLLTNMHASMGRLARAGFVAGEEKIRGTSFNYEIEEVLEEGKRWGFEVVGTPAERGVGEGDVGVGRLLGERGRKWIGTMVWFGVVLRFVSEFERE